MSATLASESAKSSCARSGGLPSGPAVASALRISSAWQYCCFAACRSPARYHMSPSLLSVTVRACCTCKKGSPDDDSAPDCGRTCRKLTKACLKGYIAPVALGCCAESGMSHWLATYLSRAWLALLQVADAGPIIVGSCLHVAVAQGTVTLHKSLLSQLY